jgi:hypothetical protein
VNDLAKTLRMAYLPGEKIKLELTQKGNDQHQAIGHLDDGTMVVVEHASSQIGKIVEIEFIRGLQTAAGKMMFARLVGGGDRDVAKKASLGVKRSAKVQLPKQKTTRTPRVQNVPAPAVIAQPSEPLVEVPAPVTQERTPRPRKPQQPRQSRQNAQEQSPDAQQKQAPRNNGRNNRRRTPEDSLFELLDKQ